VRTFQDEDGQRWVASVGFRPGRDYQGRYFFVVRREEEAGKKRRPAIRETGSVREEHSPFRRSDGTRRRRPDGRWKPCRKWNSDDA